MKKHASIVSAQGNTGHFPSEREYLFTSESVSEGHPDKIADQISDAVLDWVLAQDPEARVACETLIAKDLIVVAGEFGSAQIPDFIDRLSEAIPAIARATVREIGYSQESGFDPEHCEVKLSLSEQSAHIAQGVGQADGAIGAGDQGLMFGYACDETPELMPLPISLAHALMQRQAELRKSGVLPWLRPDAKSQVTVRYRGHTPIAVEKVVLSTQHTPEVDDQTITQEVIRQIIEPVIPEALRSADIVYLVNPTGRFEIGGPLGDTGLTGRKIIVDSYGGSCSHGGGAFSGKDPTKVDRSAAYAARYVAKNIVAAGLARRCTVQLSYAIGVADPLSVFVDTHGTGSVDDAKLEVAVSQVFDLKPSGIIASLDLRRPIYRETAAYGHFGRHEAEFTWERTDRLESLRLTLAYLATVYQVEDGKTLIPFNVNQTSKEIADLMSRHGVREAAFITAWSPGSKQVSEDQNIQAMQKLVVRVKNEGYPFLTGLGTDPTGQWPSEPSLFILGMPEEEASHIGKEFGQNAILSISSEGYANLVCLWR